MLSSAVLFIFFKNNLNYHLFCFIFVANYSNTHQLKIL